MSVGESRVSNLLVSNLTANLSFFAEAGPCTGEAKSLLPLGQQCRA